jgi:hypothetical protein
LPTTSTSDSGMVAVIPRFLRDHDRVGARADASRWIFNPG